MFKKIFKRDKKEPKSIKEILSAFNSLEKDFEKLSEEFENLKKEKVFSIQKVGMIRFNPFAEVGSDQSFSVALLDGNDCGVVITSLYSREDNRIYAKPINNGQSQYVLSEEERIAIERAKRSKGTNQKTNGQK
ncbi:MAG: hypothetical protein COX36_03240 [Candidatus Nealsonbacteria bacterium CG23_combo_of_CG06-09_8_20_14_all_38_19]|uniref:DUF4446 domain-containing protein n=1 Tax=Candidatus Nealsonbacteria bacterium CG23_combo_of_CG06-09_8_20_14_all_38_19 TaxID=1974721 RepID=A0A2G9YW83_9BACT|nr:MAG: hypothetical protein COX36_03240 [Candidatus Nealsonbacteria bacterium CG23_combo_of_CG06-09_8_20_14_all_38_19]